MSGRSKASPAKSTVRGAQTPHDPTSVQSPPKDQYTSLASLINSPFKPRHGSASSVSARTNHLDLAGGGGGGAGHGKLNVVAERREDASSSDGGSSSAHARTGKKGTTFAIGSHVEHDAHDEDGYGSTGGDGGKPKKFKKKKLTTWGMIALTASMGGGQVSKDRRWS